MENENPYTLSFGRVPFQFISRPISKDEILKSFLSDMPNQQMYII